MSERRQHTSAFVREAMLNHYGDEFHHKHDKRHLQYRHHWRSHENTPRFEENLDDMNNQRTGWVRDMRLKKFRKEAANRWIH